MDFFQSGSSSAPAVATLLVKIGPTREHITEIRKSFSLKQTQGPVCTAAEYSAKCDATLLVTSHTAFQRNILPNTSAEYSAGNKCAHLSWYYIGLHHPFSEILLGRQFSMLILTYSFSFYHIRFTNITGNNTHCARLTNKMTGITEIRHATFWQNILPLKSHCMMSAALAASARVEYPYCACAMEYYSRISAGTNRPQINLK